LFFALVKQVSTASGFINLTSGIPPYFWGVAIR